MPDSPPSAPLVPPGCPPPLVAGLLPGEKLRWHGRAGPVALFRSQDGIFAALFLGACATISFFSSPKNREWVLVTNICFAGWLLIFVVLPLFRTHYGITDRRILILQQGRWKPLLAAIEPLPGTVGEGYVRTKHRSNGKGDVVFGVNIPVGGNFPPIKETGFYGISDVDTAAALISQVLQARPAPAAAVSS